MNPEDQKTLILYLRLALLGASVMLVLALLDWPYGYYIFLRWVVTGTAILLAFAAYALKHLTWPAVGVIVAVLFNPLVPVHLDRDTWFFIDLGVAAIWVVAFGNTYLPKKWGT